MKHLIIFQFVEKPLERVRRKIFKMDASIDEHLREERVIGHVSNVHRDKIHFKPRTVNFSWQRGLKIGVCLFSYVWLVG